MRNRLRIVAMKEDFLKDLEYLGFTARIKRISDKLIYSAIDHYKRIDIGIEPNWHIIFLILKKKEKLTITEISNQLQLSHPAVVKIVKKMKERAYLESVADSSDTRKQFISMTKKAKKELPKFEKEWDNIQQIIQELVDHNFLEGLSRFEESLNERSFSERYKQKFGGNKQ